MSGGNEEHTFARFLRHSVQALGVTTPRPLFLLDNWPGPAVPAGVGAEGAEGVGAVAAEVGVGVGAGSGAEGAPAEEAAPAPG